MHVNARCKRLRNCFKNPSGGSCSRSSPTGTEQGFGVSFEQEDGDTLGG